MKTTETELKWTLDKSDWQKIRESLALIHTLNQKNDFYDTKDLKLRQAHWALRLRYENERTFLTAKGPAKLDEHMIERPEIEMELPSSDLSKFNSIFRLSEFDYEPCKALYEIFGDQNLEKFFSFSNTREVLDWNGYQLELDCSTCEEQVRYELEWEAEPEILKKEMKSLQSWFISEGLQFEPSDQGKLSWAWGVANAV